MNSSLIPYGRQDISEEDIASVVAVLKSDYLTQGPKVPEFEERVTKYVGAQFAVAVNSATSALHIACLALGVEKGDVVWTSPITFVASANAALYCGADVDFVDIDSRTYNMSVAALRMKLAVAQKNGKLPKVVIPVHLAGQSCEMREIHELSKQYQFKIIEDASHAIGADYLGQKVGSCKYSDICVFSFHPVKIITTAEGGMAVTNNAELAERMNLFRSHGITRDTSRMQGKSDGPWYYQQIALGYNYRMTELQAALGISQMNRLHEFVMERRRLAREYDALLSHLPIQLPYQQPDSASAYHLYPIWIDQKALGVGRSTVFENLRAQDIGVNVHYIPVHLQPYYQKIGFKAGQFSEAEKYYSGAISLPLYVGLGDDIHRVIDAIHTSLDL
ncbi:UDP-4-amino-4,6-dideoxy-N-acetyl-beta-L-altrosamine transaminase [Polynucleobacter paneuropaeus]|nr:UDP-4-amino-4,6-dideoxy-N-acetyl-beta-L-altrosamine transaminase [Polynucleobacter paneuropaeus]